VIAASAVVRTPHALWSGFIRERRWGFSTQRLRSLAADRPRAVAVNSVLTAAALPGLVALAGALPGWWLAPAASAFALAALLLSFLAVGSEIVSASAASVGHQFDSDRSCVAGCSRLGLPGHGFARLVFESGRLDADAADLVFARACHKTCRQQDVSKRERGQERVTSWEWGAPLPGPALTASWVGAPGSPGGA
jgi:hypothetical protein